MISRCVILCLAGLAGAAPGAAREIAVTPMPPGQAAIGLALQTANDGDILHIQKGTYRETIVISKRITLVGEAGAVLDPCEPFAPVWQAAPEIGAGVFRAAVPRPPRTLLLDGKVLAELDPQRCQKPGDWHWKKLLSAGPPLGQFRFLRALWMHHAAEKAIYLHLADDTSPQNLKWSVLWTREPVIAFRNATGAAVSNLTIAHGFTGIALTDRSRACTVAHCEIGPWERTGILIGGGAADCLVASNRVFRGAYEDWNPADRSKARYEIWQIHKNAGFYDRVGINLFRAGANNRVQSNHIFATFDGITLGDYAVESLDKPLASPEDGQGTEISHNLIEGTRDSGIELGGGAIEVRVHHNILRQTHGGLRYKLPRIGPVYIYRNLLLDGAPFNIWYSMDDSPAEGYVYHNTIVGGSAGLIYSSFNQGGHQIGAPRWHYLNNLVIAEKGFFDNWRTQAPVNFHADYNLVAGGGKPWPMDGAKDTHSLYLKALALPADQRPPPDSPAIDAGLDLSKFPGRALPGCAPGYFQGKAPDIGAFEVK